VTSNQLEGGKKVHHYVPLQNQEFNAFYLS
jgi:hypothetical protein